MVQKSFSSEFMLDIYDKLEKLCDQDKSAEAFGHLLEVFDLPVSKKDQRVFNLLLGKNNEVLRFSGNDHLAGHLKSTVAMHTLQVMPVIAKTVIDAFPEIFEKDSPESKLKTVVHDTLEDLLMQTLMHDFGETFIEVSSLSQRRKSDLGGELPQLERQFAEFAMRLAYYAVGEAENIENPDIKLQKEKEIFDNVIDEVRENIKGAVTEGGKGDQAAFGEHIAETISGLLQPYKHEFQLSYLPAEDLRHLRNYMAAYDEPEGHSHFAYFNGSVVKNAQNTQTVLHMAQHVGEEGGVPYNLAESSEVVATLWYTDRGVRRVYDERENDNEVHQRIARQAAILSYETNRAMLEMPIPSVIDTQAGLRKNLSDSSSATEVAKAESLAKEPDRESEIRNAVGRFKLSVHQRAVVGENHTITTRRRPIDDFSAPEISVGRLKIIYKAFEDEARMNPDFIPPKKPLLQPKKGLIDSNQLSHSLRERIRQTEREMARGPIGGSNFDKSQTFYRRR